MCGDQVCVSAKSRVLHPIGDAGCRRDGSPWQRRLVADWEAPAASQMSSGGWGERAGARRERAQVAPHGQQLSFIPTVHGTQKGRH